MTSRWRFGRRRSIGRERRKVADPNIVWLLRPDTQFANAGDRSGNRNARWMQRCYPGWKDGDAFADEARPDHRHVRRLQGVRDFGNWDCAVTTRMISTRPKSHWIDIEASHDLTPRGEGLHREPSTHAERRLAQAQASAGPTIPAMRSAESGPAHWFPRQSSAHRKRGDRGRGARRPRLTFRQLPA